MHSRALIRSWDECVFRSEFHQPAGEEKNGDGEKAEIGNSEMTLTIGRTVIRK